LEDGPGTLEIFSKGWVGFDVQEDSTFCFEVSWSTWLCIEISSESLGEDMNWSDDLIFIGSTDIAILNEEIFRILGELRGQ